MVEHITNVPEDSEALVALAEYLKESRETTAVQLQNRIDEAYLRLDFLLDYRVVLQKCH